MDESQKEYVKYFSGKFLEIWEPFANLETNTQPSQGSISKPNPSTFDAAMDLYRFVYAHVADLIIMAEEGVQSTDIRSFNSKVKDKDVSTLWKKLTDLDNKTGKAEKFFPIHYLLSIFLAKMWRNIQKGK